MRYFTTGNPYNSSCSTAILIKGSCFIESSLIKYYFSKLNLLGVPDTEIIAFTLKYENDKAPAKVIKEYLSELLPDLKEMGVKYLYVADSTYFKTLTKNTKADPHHGYVLPCAIKGYEHINVVLGVNHRALLYDPTLHPKLDSGLEALVAHKNGSYSAPGSTIIHSSDYPNNLIEIANTLNKLHQHKVLTADIEAFSLRFNKAGVGSISFAWDQHNGIAFLCDYTECTPFRDDFGQMIYGFKTINKEVRLLIRNFLETYKGKLIWHNANYDLKALIYTLWMKSLGDTHGLLKGLEVVTRLFDDTKLIAYLATNSTAGNVLGLKHLAHDFAGNWANDNIKNITQIPKKELLQYNLVDSLSTFYVHNKYYSIMVLDNQETIYKEIFLPSVKTLLQTELTGMPMSKRRIQQSKKELEGMRDGFTNFLNNSPVIKLMNILVRESALEATNSKLKTKQHTIDKYASLKFNANSGPQLQRLLYELMGLPILDYTDTKLPATGADTLEKLIHHTEEKEYKDILEALIGNSKVQKILSTFIPAFENALSRDCSDTVWLHGNFNLGGAVTGRLSSSAPNLQNLPAGSIYGKMVKSCFVAPEGFLMVGADFSSLEDRISALTTKDTNKLKVYIDGYDGHCLRAYAYFKDQMIDIHDSVESINSIDKVYKPLRQDSKAPTFLLTYGGTYHGMMKNLGWTEEKAKAVETNYHMLYKESGEYIQARLKQASLDGYVDVAFGLRVRTPLLGQIIYGSSHVPYAASAEARTAGNAMGQSYCLLNNRAANAFMEKVWASEHRYSILPIAPIHDANYFICIDDVKVVAWLNKHLAEEMQWQELPEIQHPLVKLGGELDIFWPSWANSITIPNNISSQEIIDACVKGKFDYIKKEIK